MKVDNDGYDSFVTDLSIEISGKHKSWKIKSGENYM
jgi:hypothetical protein